MYHLSEIVIVLALVILWPVNYCYQTFLPRDAMRKRGLCCRPVSVRLSVTFVDCIHTAEDIVKLLFSAR